MEPTPTVRVATARQSATRRRALVLTPTTVILLVGLLITAVVGGILAGAWLNNVTPPDLATSSPGVTAPPSTATPTARAGVTFDCPAAQASAAIRTNKWRSGPAFASPQAGWIAVWGTDPRPELILVNPVTGDRCSLITFDVLTTPAERPATGALAWSPDGGALAMVVTESQPCCRYSLYVWSALGLAGPIIEVRENSYLEVPSWSPDGSLLAVGRSTGSILGAIDPASAWIIAGDGSAPREVHANCVACFGGSVHWSPSGDKIAFRTWTNADNGESMGVAVGTVDDQAVPLLPGTSGGDGLLGWASDESLWVVPFGVTVPVNEPEGAGRVFEVPLDPRVDRVDHGFLPAGPGVMPSGVAISPDGTQVLQLVERPRVLISDLMLADFRNAGATRLVEGLPSNLGPVWWSPDGRTIGYLIDVETPEQGIWLVNPDGTGLHKLVGGSLVIGRGLEGLDTTLLKVWQPRP